MALAALAQEHRGTAREAGLRRAGATAWALAGDFDAAFRAGGEAPGAMPDLWRILAASGPDAALLAHAVTEDAAAMAAAPAAARRRIADRLSGLGLPGPALAWRGGGADDAGDAASAGPGPATPRQARRAGDWDAVSRGPDPVWAAAARTVAGGAGEAMKGGPDAGPAASRPSDPPGSAGALARGAALVRQTAETRAAIDALLAAVPPPGPGSAASGAAPR